MAIEEFKTLLLAASKTHFPHASVTLHEKRSIIVEARINITEQLFIHVCFNALTERKSYVLILKDKRVMGYDNRRFWHQHPLENPKRHVRCKEPDLDLVFKEMRDAVEKLQ